MGVSVDIEIPGSLREQVEAVAKAMVKTEGRSDWVAALSECLAQVGYEIQGGSHIQAVLQ